MDIVRQGEGSGVEKEVVENMRHQLHLLSQVHVVSLNLVMITKRKSWKRKKFENGSKTCAMDYITQRLQHTFGDNMKVHIRV